MIRNTRHVHHCNKKEILLSKYWQNFQSFSACGSQSTANDSTTLSGVICKLQAHVLVSTTGVKCLMGDGDIRSDMTTLLGITGFEGIKEIPLHGATSSWSLSLWRRNDHYSGRTAPLTSKRCILYIYSTKRGTEYFKHGIYSPFFLFKMQFVS